MSKFDKAFAISFAALPFILLLMVIYLIAIAVLQAKNVIPYATPLEYPHIYVLSLLGLIFLVSLISSFIFGLLGIIRS